MWKILNGKEGITNDKSNDNNYIDVENSDINKIGDKNNI